MEVEEVVIVGAGIAGLATAVALKRVGIRSLVLERSEGLRATGAALSLFPNAWDALDALGVAHKLTSIYPITNRGHITDVASGSTREVPLTGTHGNGIGPRIIHRQALMEALSEELPIETIRYSSKLTSIEAQQQGSSIVTICIEDGTMIKTKVLIGCDGVHSGVARWLGLSAPVNSGRSAVRGLAVYPKGHGFKLEVQQFVDVGKRGGFAPLNDTDIYWFIVVNSTSKDEDIVRSPEMIQREVLENFAKDFPQTYLDVVRHSVVSTLTWAPLMFRLPWDVVLRNACTGTVTVAGDAMHPMTPDLGQGGGTALEDGVVLGRHIGESFIQNGAVVPIQMQKAMERYVKERRWHVARVITGSYLSGWMQQGGSGWWIKFFRDVIFYRFLFRWIVGNIRYNCGKLPTISSGELENRTKHD